MIYKHKDPIWVEPQEPSIESPKLPMDIAIVYLVGCVALGVMAARGVVWMWLGV